MNARYDCFCKLTDLLGAQESLTEARRHLHQFPELSFQEKSTAQWVGDKLQAWGYQVTRNVGGHGLVATLKNGEGKGIALRADMDALPIQEETQKPYASQHAGTMHACGHDGHTAMLLGAAQQLAKTKNFKGTVHLVFQPAEEAGKNSGAQQMIADGLFERFPCDAIFGIHNHPGADVGTFMFGAGAFMSASDTCYIKVQGKGGHAAMPHLTKDPVAAAGMCILALQTLISRQLDPFDQAVISLTKLEAGSAFNVIPATATIGGTLRTMNAETRLRMIAEIETTAKNAAATLGCNVAMELRPGYPPTLNHESDALFARDIITDMLGADGLETSMTPVMGAEDFSFMLEKKPGAYIWLGAGLQSENLHSPHFDFNDDLLPIGASFWVQLAQSKLAINISAQGQRRPAP